MRQFFTCVLCLLAVSLSAQSEHQPDDFCATQQGRSKWLKQYQAQPAAYRKGGDTTIYVAMSIHILGTDDGNGYYSEKNLLDAFCLLNESFEPAGIQFFMAGNILYHDNSDYYQHETVLEGATMMFEYNIPNTLNTYFVSDPAGNCGYNLPYAGIANAINCSGPIDITWSHEVGHALSLPHPFLGWEGGVSWDGSIDHNFGDPAPDRVTYNYTFFQDILILDTLIIDTAFVEKIDGSNCNVAADGFCDTPPDYLAGRWNCNGNGISPTVQHDPNDISFQSEGSFIMNYANDECQNRFSEEQQAAMRAFLYDQREEWISNAPALDPVTETVDLLTPTGGESVEDNIAELSWTAVPEATQYLVQISRLASFSPSLTENYLVNTNSIDVAGLLEDRTYFWRVRAFNNYATCGEFSTNESFELSFPPLATRDIDGLSDWRAFPQPVGAERQLQLELNMTANWTGTLQLLNPLGQTLRMEELSLQAGLNNRTIDLATVAPGVYFLRLQNGREQQTVKVLVGE